MTTRTDPQRKVRLPRDLDAWLEQQAKANRRSLNAEVAVLVEEARRGREEKEAAGQALQA